MDLMASEKEFRIRVFYCKIDVKPRLDESTRFLSSKPVIFNPETAEYPMISKFDGFSTGNLRDNKF